VLLQANRALHKVAAMTPHITLADPESAEARFCLQSYYDLLNARFSTGFEVSKSLDPQADAMRLPKGGFWLAHLAGQPVACVGLKGGAEYGEIKRLWVADTARGHGLGRRLMKVAEDHAKTLGMTTLRLDTNVKLPEAIALYRATGWSEIERYNDDPYPTHFFEKRL
jgi:GNAT superfamily N-acetyltransferase